MGTLHVLTVQLQAARGINIPSVKHESYSNRKRDHTLTVLYNYGVKRTDSNSADIIRPTGMVPIT